MTGPIVINPEAIGDPDQTPVVYLGSDSQWDYVRDSVGDDLVKRFGDVDVLGLDLSQPFDCHRLAAIVLKIIDDAMEDHL
jgi:hypothetical protein